MHLKHEPATRDLNLRLEMIGHPLAHTRRDTPSLDGRRLSMELGQTLPDLGQTWSRSAVSESDALQTRHSSDLGPES